MSSDRGSQPLAVNGISHGWIRPAAHPELGVEVPGQSVVRYLRFGRPVRVDRLELKPVIAGRWTPSVPTHPAHVTVCVPDESTGRWRMIQDVELPPDERIAGAGLHQGMTTDEMDRLLRPALDVTHAIELGGVKADLLRVECDREHPVWPNHGECNGSPLSVPFATLNSLAAFGEAPSGESPLPAYLPPLTVGKVKPSAPAGMRVEAMPWMVRFEGERLSIGFSLVRPEILHLGFDGTASGRAGENRVHSRVGGWGGLFSGPSGPVLRTAGGDWGANLWTGTVEVAGSSVRYRDLHCGQGLWIDATFCVEADGFRLDLSQRSDGPIAAIESEAWRLTWDCGAAMTAAAAVPTQREGRNGEVELPMLWAGDGNGALACSRRNGEAWLQVDSNRTQRTVIGGLILGQRPEATQCLTVPAGETTSIWDFRVTAFRPARIAGGVAACGELPEAIRRHWGSVYSCYRPEYGGFSNNAVSVNCHVNQHTATELSAFTAVPAAGPAAIDLYRFTIERALLGGGGYGFWRNLYLDSDPILVSGAGRVHQVWPEADWLRRIEPGLAAAARRMLGTIGPGHLAVCRDLSGDSGSYRWSSNAMDVVGFGHVDAYVNAWTYRGLRNASALLMAAGQAELADRCHAAADELRDAYAPLLLNPATGWVAGWRSRDGELHDAAYLWVNGVACAFGLLPADEAAEALRRLEELRQQVGAGRAHFGLPFNLLPIPPEDHLLPHLHGRFAPTFENYTDGAMAPGAAPFYLRALDIHGLGEPAGQIAADLEVGYCRGHFNGPVGSGVEFNRWDGVPCGYEGTFGANWPALYAIAVHRGLIQPTDPEWWL